MTIEAMQLPGTAAHHDDRVRWFSGLGCVQWDTGADGESAEVFVAGSLVGKFTRRDRGTRNVVLLGLADDPKAHLGRLASAFRISEETLRLIRLQREKEGLRAVLDRAPGGSERKLQGKDLRFAEKMFGRGASLRQVEEALAERGLKISIGTLSEARSRWTAVRGGAGTADELAPGADRAAEHAAGTPDRGAAMPADAGGADIQEAIRFESNARDASAEMTRGPTAEGTAEAAIAGDEAGAVAPPAAEAEAAEENDRQAASERIPELPPRSGRFVQSIGTWLLLGMVNTLGLYSVVERERTRADRSGRRLRVGTVRIAVDALIAALAVGQRCVEGVRRLQTASAGMLLRAARGPSASWVRRVLGWLAGDAGSAYVGLAMAGANTRGAQEATEKGRPVVFYVDNHMRKYTGKHVVRKGWRMQDKRAVPGISDGYVHDEDGRALFRLDLPAHDSLTSVLGRVTELLRLALGDDERILVAFDRAGAFPEQLATLRNAGFEFVTYERRPYERLPASAMTHSLCLDGGEVLRWCEPRQKNLGRGRGRVRRIVVMDADGYQINILAVSDQPAEWLIEVMRGRWNQENGFKHAVERWGQNQLDGRTVAHYPPETVIPNPARRRLDHALRIARVREGDARRVLARMAARDPKRAKVEQDLADAIAQQQTLEAQRPHVPEHDELQNTDLAGRLVHHVPEYKLLVDTIRTACANAESELASLLAPHMTRPREAKKLLANILAAPGHVTVDGEVINVTLLCAANGAERRAVEALLREVSRQNLTLPGDAADRPLVFRSQESVA